MKLLELYNARIVEALTLNEVNQMHIAFANSLTPTEVVYLHGNLFAAGKHKAPKLSPLCRFTLPQLQEAGRLWIEQLRTTLSDVGKSRTELYRRHDLHDAMVLFSGDRKKPRRNLMVALTGANQRLMMPIATFLQNCDAGSTDILYVRDSSRRGFRDGVPGLADEMAEIGPALTKLIDMSQYQRRVSVGVSAGGLPGLVLALRLGFDATLVCGGSSPFRGQFDKPGARLFADKLQGWRSEAPGVQVIALYGAQEPVDETAAAEILQCVPGTEVVRVALDGVEVKHNMLYKLSAAGLLAAFFKDRLGLSA
jgi:hypothetical protein